MPLGIGDDQRRDLVEVVLQLREHRVEVGEVGGAGPVHEAQAPVDLPDDEPLRFEDLERVLLQQQGRALHLRPRLVQDLAVAEPGGGPEQEQRQQDGSGDEGEAGAGQRRRGQGHHRPSPLGRPGEIGGGRRIDDVSRRASSIMS